MWGDRLVRRRTLIVVPFCCILCHKAEEDLDHYFGIVSMYRLCGALSAGVVWLARGSFKGRSRSSSFIRLFERETAFCGWMGCVLCFGIFGERGMVGCLEVRKGTSVRFGH